jgi:hypothetical protein
MNESLKKISEKCVSDAAKTSPVVLHIVDEPKRIPFNDFFNDDELIKIYNNQKGDGPVRNRTAIKEGNRYDFSPQISSKWESIVRMSHCFEMLAKRIETLLNSQNNDKLSTDITLVQEILGAVYQLILDMNVEFGIFNFRVSKEFQSVLHVCAVISIVLFYYTRYKKHFDEVISSLHKKKSDLRDRFVRMVVIEDNDDENIAINLVKEFTEVLRQSFNSKVKEIISKQAENNSATLDRNFIIKKLDEEVDKATDDWLMEYILRPLPLIGWQREVFKDKLVFQLFGSENYFDLEFQRLLIEIGNIFNSFFIFFFLNFCFLSVIN